MRTATSLALLAALGVSPAPAAIEPPSLPLFFVPNAGQAHPAVRFLVQTPGLRAGFTPNGVVFQAHGKRLSVRFPGSNPAPALPAGRPLPGRANFIRGSHRTWSVPLYEQIVYRNLYPGIDLRYSVSGASIKSEFFLAAGALPSLVRIQYPGAKATVDASGDLVVARDGVELREQSLAAWQPLPGASPRPVRARFRVLRPDTVGFQIDGYDPALPLVIDPVISYSTYLGGTGMGAVTGVAVDSSGNQYVAGWTESLDFPIAGAVYAANRGGVDVFVAKFNPSGNTLLYATYYGGSGDDRAAAIAVNSSGQAYIAGSTTSGNFPLTAAWDSTYNGGRDAFLFMLTAGGNSVVFSTYFGGTNWDAATAVALDSSGNAYLAGDTYSSNFPVQSAAQTTFGGAADAFAAKFTPAGALSYSTYLGGLNAEHAGGIAVDSSGQAHVAGGTSSTNFPLAAPWQSSNAGGQDAFLTRLSASGSQLLYSTYLGGSAGGGGFPEQANAVAVDASGAAYLAGATPSPNFPATAGAFQTANSGSQDAFAAKLSAAGALVYSTYLGGTSFDWATGVAVDSGGNAHIAGYTSSFGFPVAAAVQTAFNGMYDAFVTRLSAAGNSVSFSTFYGGTGSDVANAIALDAGANIYLGGQTASVDFPLAGAIQSNNIGGSTGWVARLGVTAPPPQTPSADSVSPPAGSGNTVNFTAQYSHPAGATSLTTVALLVNAAASTSFACYVSYDRAANVFKLWNDTASSATTIVPGSGIAAQNSQCTLSGAGSSASVSGALLTLNLALTFRPGFQGAKTVYLYAADAASNTGWIARGTWTVTVPPPMPSADSVTPNAASGASQTFTFVFSHSQDQASIRTMAMLFHTSISTANGCYIVYDRNAGTVQLLWDNGLGSNAKPVDSPAILENTQCAVGAVTSSITGLSFIPSISVTFKGPFNGLKNIYMYATDGVNNTGWVQGGTYNVGVGGFPVAESVVPAAGTGPGQRFTFTMSDPGGTGNIVAAAMLFSPVLSTANACSLVWDRTAGTISLAYDNPANGATPVVAGSAAEASNSQCTLRAVNSTVTIGATTVVITVDVVFHAAFAGARYSYLYVAETAANSGWVTLGSWTVTGGAPTADSMSPSSGTGYAPAFTFTVSDTVTQANIVGMSILFTAGSPANTANACYLVYNRPAGTIGLYNDAGVTLSTKPIGSSATLENSQCAVGYTAVSISGTSLTLTVNPVLFKPAFSGVKSAYLLAQEPGASSGWVLRGSWTVP
jgi:hypothetical protein